MSKKTKQQYVIIGAILVVAIFLFIENVDFGENAELKEYREGDYVWQLDYQTDARQELDNYNDLTTNTLYYDFNHKLIEDAAERVRLTSTNSREAMENTLRLVHDKVEYNFDEMDNACFVGTAPQILELGSGQCDTQSLVVVSILRKIGIAARPIGGCIVKKASCTGLQSIFTDSIPALVLDKQALFAESDTEFSRRGGLHAWVQAWDEDEGWLVLESTAGTIANLDCYDYHIEVIPNNNQKDQICVSDSYEYYRACKNDNYNELDKYGLGLFQEVSINE